MWESSWWDTIKSNTHLYIPARTRQFITSGQQLSHLPSAKLGLCSVHHQPHWNYAEACGGQILGTEGARLRSGGGGEDVRRCTQASQILLLQSNRRVAGLYLHGMEVCLPWHPAVSPGNLTLAWLALWTVLRVAPSFQSLLWLLAASLTSVPSSCPRAVVWGIAFTPVGDDFQEYIGNSWDVFFAAHAT